MAGAQSFDITTGCDLQEVDNAINQAMKEINQRYDFKGLKVGIDFLKAENKLVLRAPDDFKLKSLWEVLQEKLVRRKVPVRNLQPGQDHARRRRYGHTGYSAAARYPYRDLAVDRKVHQGSKDEESPGGNSEGPGSSFRAFAR